MRYKYHIKSRTIRRLLKVVVHPGVPIEYALIANVCARSKVVLSGIEQDDFGVERLMGITTEAGATLLDKSVSDALNGKICGVDLNDTDFVGFHTRQIRTMLVEALEKGKEVDQMISFFAKAKSADNFFDYRVSYKTDGKISGVCWKTGTMRKHCKDGLLDIIMLDMMKRQINSSNWPYCGPVMITVNNVVVCVCKAIFISETLAAYACIMNRIYSMSVLSHSVTKLVFGNVMLSANLLKDLVIQHTVKLILDQYHLNENWKNVWG